MNLYFRNGNLNKAIIDGMKYINKIIFRKNEPPSSCVVIVKICIMLIN